MARSLIACCAHDIREPFAKDLEAYARTYANQRLREAAGTLRDKAHGYANYEGSIRDGVDEAASIILGMIEGEP